MNDITPKEAIANLNHIYGFVAPDIQRSLDVAIKALERPQDKHDRQEGEWVKCGWSIRCSICNYDMPYTVRNFCPNCGADMRVKENKNV